MNYQHMTNPEIVAALQGADEGERAKALASLGKDQRKAVEEALGASLKTDGARAAVLERLGREKQIVDTQAYTADGRSPNSPLVTAATAGKYEEAENGEAVLDSLVSSTQAKAEASGDVLAAAGKDTAATLSAETAAGEGDEAETDAETPEAPAKHRGKLPADFPGKAALEAAGVTTYAQARKLRDGDGLTSVAGIGDATASQIDEALKE